MAIYRPPAKCPYCGENVKFIPNKAKNNFVGDTGGQYDFDGHYRKCKKLIRLDKINKVINE